MLVRRDTLPQALSDIESGAIADAETVIVSREWWDALSSREQDGYRERADRAKVHLSADRRLGSHFVEVRGRGGEAVPRISTERDV